MGIMRRFLLAACLSLLTGSCSWYADLVLVNASSYQAFVVLTLVRRDAADPYCRCPLGFVEPPLGRAAPAGNLEDAHWIHLDSTMFRLIPAHRRLEIQLPPGTAIRIDRIPNYSGRNNESWVRYLRSEALEVHTPVRVLHLRGEKILNAFTKRSNHLYVLELANAAT